MTSSPRGLKSGIKAAPSKSTAGIKKQEWAAAYLPHTFVMITRKVNFYGGVERRAGLLEMSGSPPLSSLPCKDKTAVTTYFFK